LNLEDFNDCYCGVVQEVLEAVCINDIELIPDVTCNKDWFAHKVNLHHLPVHWWT